jgi:antitoxin component YwqK of YwqJK toxin-antitoxin module
MDIVDGTALTFYPNGQQRSQCLYRNGKPYGMYKMWRPDGTLALEDWLDCGKSSGEQKLFYQNGAIKSIVRFCLGRVVFHKEYDERGLKVVDRVV